MRERIRGYFVFARQKLPRLYDKRQGPGWLPTQRHLFIYALGLSFFLEGLLLLCTGPLHFPVSTVSAHALPTRSDPAADAVLNTPPQQVHMWFSEELIPQTSRLLVIDTTNHEVDTRDSQVENADEMRVTLPLLPAGTYVVVWRSQSAFDGHIAGGSFIFRIARPDGTVPPIPSILPTGHVPGAAGTSVAGNNSFDQYSLMQTVMTWLALLTMTFWAGGWFWETWILPPGTQKESALRQASHLSSMRFSRLAPFALILLLLADLGIIMVQGASLVGDWSGAFSLPLLSVILFHSRFGDIWWVRQIVVLLALALTLLAVRKGWSAWTHEELPETVEKPEENIRGTEPISTTAQPLRSWPWAIVESLHAIPTIPQQLARGWQQRSWYGKGELICCLTLLLAFALSGHAAAVSSNQLWYSLGSDLLHLLGDTIWVGGLCYIGIVLVPVLAKLAQRQRAQVLALGLPEFSALAIITVLLLAATGSLNTTVHLTSFDQFWTTLYGRTLTVKIVLFLLMALISAYHAFYLRSHLVQTLSLTMSKTIPAAVIHAAGSENTIHELQEAHQDGSLERSLHRQTQQMMRWLQLEAGGGVAILLCVALLGAFGGTLTRSTTQTNATTNTQGAQAPSAFVQTKQASGYTITLRVSPDSFGTNTFTVTLQDTKGQVVKGAAVLITTTMLDMDMGTQTAQLQPVQGRPGSYTVQSDLTMAGHWELRVRILPPNQNTFIFYDFTFATAQAPSPALSCVWGTTRSMG